MLRYMNNNKLLLKNFLQYLHDSAKLFHVAGEKFMAYLISIKLQCIFS